MKGLTKWSLGPIPLKSRLKYPCNVHGNIHAEKSIYLKILEWTSMVHGVPVNLHTLLHIITIALNNK